MKIRLLIILASACFVLMSGTIDIVNFLNYTNQPLPSYVNSNKDNTPNTNPISNPGATLGSVLFYDKNLITNQTRELLKIS